MELAEAQAGRGNIYRCLEAALAEGEQARDALPVTAIRAVAQVAIAQGSQAVRQGPARQRQQMGGRQDGQDADQQAHDLVGGMTQAEDLAGAPEEPKDQKGNGIALQDAEPAEGILAAFAEPVADLLVQPGQQVPDLPGQQPAADAQ